MKNWLKQTSTIGGLLSLVLTGLHAYQSGLDAVTIAIATISAALLLVNDGKFLAGLCAVLFIGSMSSACATVPITGDTIKAAASIGCAVAQSSGCFEELQDGFPGLSADVCTQVIGAAVSAAVEIQNNFESMPREDAAVKSVNPMFGLLDTVNRENWDPLDVDLSRIGLDSSCRKLGKALGVK